MQDNYSVEYEMTDDLAVQLTRAALTDRRYFLQLARGSAILLFLLMVLLFWPTILVIRDQLTPGILIAVVAVLAIGFWLMLRVLVYRYAYFATVFAFLGQSPRLMRLTFSNDRIALEIAGVVAEQSWKDVEQIQLFGPFWLFRLRSGSHFALPVAVLSPDLEEFLRRKTGEMGIAVQD